MSKVFFASEEAQKRAVLQCDVVADGPAQHGIASLERIQHRPLRDRTFDLEGYLTADVGQVSEMWGENDANHDRNYFTEVQQSHCNTIGRENPRRGRLGAIH